MDYRIARGSAIYGPYTEAEVREHLASGHVVPTDLARSGVMDEWIEVAMLFPGPEPVGRKVFPNPPDLRWYNALVLEVVTLSAFFFVWDLVEAAWMHRVAPRSRALYWYTAVAILFAFSAPDIYHSIMHALFNGPVVDVPYAAPLAITGFCVRLVARFSLRRSLCDHFNRAEPIGLRLSSFMTLLFGGLYFQYHLNRINEMKRQLGIEETQRVSPSPMPT